MKKAAGKILYALLFLVVIPAILVGWAVLTEDVVRLPAITSNIAGTVLIAIGIILVAWGWIELKVVGKGLPMNAFPPPNLVTSGPYRFVRHPVYWGCGLLAVGISILTGSASGLWLVSPLTILGMIALVLGYEKLDLQQRFPYDAYNTVFGLPGISASSPALVQRITTSIILLLALVMTNGIIFYLAGDSRAITASGPIDLPFGQRTPVPGFIAFVLVPFVLKTQSQLRQFRLSTLAGLALLLYLALLWPGACAQYFPVNGMNEYWSLATVHIGILMVSLRMTMQGRRMISFVLVPLIALIIFYQLVISTSPWLYLIVGLLIFTVASWYGAIWGLLRRLTETIANSWKEWTIGPVRIINHGFYVGASVFLAGILCGVLAGSQYAWALLAFAVTVIVFSAIWAQVIEGSEKLKRPYGYYGALVGIAFGALVIRLLGYDVWVVLAVLAVTMPWAQAIGRLRCLINGCCHGRMTENEDLGIRYFHFRSRVCGISGLKGELLHPTPLYSILWLFFTGFVLLALWFNDCSPSFLFGMYFVLTGLGRFVEEAYRGEVQTPILAGLRLYQWTAIASVLVGIVFTSIPMEPVLLQPRFDWSTVYASLIAGVFTVFAMGVDFPGSNARFSRLV